MLADLSAFWDAVSKILILSWIIESSIFNENTSSFNIIRTATNYFHIIIAPFHVKSNPGK